MRTSRATKRKDEQIFQLKTGSLLILLPVCRVNIIQPKQLQKDNTAVRDKERKNLLAIQKSCKK